MHDCPSTRLDNSILMLAMEMCKQKPKWKSTSKTKQKERKRWFNANWHYKYEMTIIWPNFNCHDITCNSTYSIFPFRLKCECVWCRKYVSEVEREKTDAKATSLCFDQSVFALVSHDTILSPLHSYSPSHLLFIISNLGVQAYSRICCVGFGSALC